MNIYYICLELHYDCYKSVIICVFTAYKWLIEKNWWLKQCFHILCLNECITNWPCLLYMKNTNIKLKNKIIKKASQYFIIFKLFLIKKTMFGNSLK